MGKFRKIVCCVCAVTLCAGIGAVSAKHHRIRGVDYPNDPGAYYSETAIDYADSPSTFFFRDLAGSGGNVLDVTRKLKSEIFRNRFGDITGVLANITGLDIVNMTGMDTSEKERFINNLDESARKNRELGISNQVPYAESQTKFLSTDYYGETNQKEQLKYLDGVYANALQTAQNNMTDSGRRMNDIQAAAMSSANAAGDVQAIQADSEMQALSVQEKERSNVLIGNYNAIEAAHNMAENDQAIRDTLINRHALRIKILDPYNPSGSPAEDYDRPKPPGFFDF